MDLFLAAITKEARDVITNVLIILMTVISLAIIVIVLMQESNADDVTALSGGSADSFYGKNKGRTKEVILKRLTLILGAVMLVISVVFFVVKSIPQA